MKNNQQPRRRESVFTLSALALCMPAWGHEPQFNTHFVHGAQNVDAVQQMANNDGLSEGVFEYDIYLDHNFIETRQVSFQKSRPDTKPRPCLKADTLRGYGIKLPTALNDDCVDLASQIPYARLDADANYQRIDLSIPEAWMVDNAHDAVPVSAYDDGINAAYLGYNASANRQTSQDTHYDSLFVGLDGGINLAGWHLRNQSSLSNSNSSGSHWQAISTWVERNIVALRSRLRIGQTFTSDQVFDSIQFTGAQLTSDDNMLPDSLRGFAPVVRGMANSNATVDIRQNGYLIYSKSVAPGAFDIDDINPSTQSGDLDVTVTEANGSRRSFSVPYSAVPNMLRAGSNNYQLTAGQYRDGYDGWQPRFLQGTLSHGFVSGTTLYGGLLSAQDYNSLATGIAQDLWQFGAISFDITTARAQLAIGDSSIGQSYRFLYSKSLTDYGTDFRLVGYRYNTSGYYSFNDVISEHNAWASGFYDIQYDDPGQQFHYAGETRNKKHFYTGTYSNRRQRLEASVNQRLWGDASMFLSTSDQSYWYNNHRDRTLQVGYNDMVGTVSWSLYFQNTRSQYGYEDRSVNLTVSIPLNFMKQAGTASLNIMHSKNGGDQYATNYSSSAFDNHLGWGVQTSTTDRQQHSAGMNASWQGDATNLQGSYSTGKNYQSINLGMNGGLMLHSGGLTLMHAPGDTMVLVEAKNAKGVHLLQQPDVAIDGNGYAVMTTANAWHYNPVSLNTADIGAGLDVPQAQKKVVPTEKAISKVVFDTFVGRNYLVNALMADHVEPPVGANVRDVKGRNHGLVGMHGQLYVSGVQDADKLEVRWGAHPNEHCFIRMPDNHGKPAQHAGYEQINAQCTGA